MAAVDTGNNPNDPNNPNNVPGAVNQPGAQVNQPATTGGGAGPVTATGAGNVTGQVVGTANPSQPFQNISSYLAANAPQSQALAGQVAGTVAAPITEAQQGITGAAGQFTESVNKGYTPANQDLTTAVSENPAYVVAENPENATNFQALLNNKYTGPTDFTQQPGYADLQAKIAQAQGAAANTQNEAGIQTLLQGVEGPTTAGINKLDSLLLNMNPENLKTIQAAGAPASGLLPALNQTTAEQNALAQTGQKTAQQTAADALAALTTARGSESANLTGEQNTIQDIVNQYNKSVGIINPVVQNITQAVQDFLAANPQVKYQLSGDPMADIRNLTNIAMPELATYATPEDYAQIAALTQLGDTGVGGLPINAGQANLAETFKVPTALQDAIGKAPGVESALSNEIGGIGNTINQAVAPFTQAEQAAYNWVTAGQPAQAALAGDQQKLNDPNGNLTDADRAALTTDMAKQQSIVDANPEASWDAVAPIAQSLQWVNGAETSYQQLVDAINGQLGKLGEVGVPTLNYGPSAMAAPVMGTPIGQTAALDVGKAANTAAIGGTAAGATGAGILAAGAGDVAAGEPLVQGLGTGAGLGAGLETAATTLPPAALAAYGASNIAKNTAANPLRSGLMTAANMGLSLATLSLPPQIFNSIGKDISNVVNSIGDFFGGLF